MAYFNLCGIDRFGRRQERDLDLKLAEFVQPQWRETRIVQRSTGGATNDGVGERFFRFDDANTSTQTAFCVERHKHSAALGKDSFGAGFFGEILV